MSGNIRLLDRLSKLDSSNMAQASDTQAHRRIDAALAEPEGDATIKTGTSSAAFGRPTRRGRERLYSEQAVSARRQEITVSGLTRMRASDQLLHIRRTTTQNRRSDRRSLGCGCLRL